MNRDLRLSLDMKKNIKVDRMDRKKFDNFISDELTMDQISVACALDYTSFRFTKDWSLSNPKLNKWLEKITENEFMQSTLPGESFKYE